MVYILDTAYERRQDKRSKMFTAGKSVWRGFGNIFDTDLLVFVKICIKK